MYTAQLPVKVREGIGASGAELQGDVSYTTLVLETIHRSFARLVRILNS